MEPLAPLSFRALMLDIELSHLPNHIRSSAVNLGSRIEAAEKVTTALVESNIRRSYYHPARKSIMNYFDALKKDFRRKIRCHQIWCRLIVNAKADNQSMTAHTQGAMSGGENTLPPWSESPLAVVYGTDISALIIETSPGIIDGFWKERRHTLLRRHFQLKRLTDRLGELIFLIEYLEMMARFLFPYIPPLCASFDFLSMPQLLSDQLDTWIQWSTSSSIEVAIQGLRAAKEGLRLSTRSRWANTQCRRWALQSEQLVIRNKRFPIQSRRFATQSQRLCTRFRQSLTQSCRLIEQSQFFTTQAVLFLSQCQLFSDCKKLFEDVQKERRRAGQLADEYTADFLRPA